MPRAPIDSTVGDWMDLSEKVAPEAAAGAVPLEHAHTKLAGYLGEVQKLLAERDFHEARKQDATKRIREILPAGCRTATLIRKILKDHYGPDSERLAAFGIQPFRPRKRGPRKPKQVKDSAVREGVVDPQPSGDSSR
jgi:hypothetical protein